MIGIVELRRYLLHPGRRDELIELFERELIDPQEDLGMAVLGQFRDLDEPDQFVWLRGFTDLAARDAGLRAFYGGPVWAGHRAAANATMIDSDNVFLLRPIDDWAVTGSRPGADGNGEGMVVAAVVPDGSGGGLPAPAGGVEIARLVTESAANTFPALPVRTDVRVAVLLVAFADDTAADAYAAAARRDVPDALVSRLRPTGRSLVHG